MKPGKISSSADYKFFPNFITQSLVFQIFDHLAHSICDFFLIDDKCSEKDDVLNKFVSFCGLKYLDYLGFNNLLFMKQNVERQKYNDNGIN